MAALWYEGSCRLLWRFYSGDSHSPDTWNSVRIIWTQTWRRLQTVCWDAQKKSATSHIIYCLVQFMEYWIRGFPTGSSVKTSCIVIKQFSGDSRCFIETSCQQEGWLLYYSLIPLTVACSMGSLPLGDPYCVQARLTTRVQILGLVRAFWLGSGTLGRGVLRLCTGAGVAR